MAQALAEYYDEDEEDAQFYCDQRKMEKINGKVYAMASPTIEHSRIVRRLYKIISDILDGNPCEATFGDTDLAYNTENKRENKRDDYVIPDLMIMCEKDKIKGGCYYGIPKFVVEVTSPSTAKRDRTTKFKIYEKLDVSEYWIIDPNGTLSIYYLKGKKYKLHDCLVLCRDEYKKDEYNENMVVKLRCFREVAVRLGELFQSPW